MPADPEVVTLDDENMKLEWTASMMCLYTIFHTFTVESDGNGGSIFTGELTISFFFLIEKIISKTKSSLKDFCKD